MTSRAAIAQHLGFDWAEMPEYRYQPSLTQTPVYTVDEDYYTAIKSGKQRIWKSERYNWVKVETIDGWDIYKS